MHASQAVCVVDGAQKIYAICGIHKCARGMLDSGSARGRADGAVLERCVPDGGGNVPDGAL